MLMDVAMNVVALEVEVASTAPLLVHRLDSRADKSDLSALLLSHLYLLPGSSATTVETDEVITALGLFAFPATAFRKSMIDISPRSGLAKSNVGRSFCVSGAVTKDPHSRELIELRGKDNPSLYTETWETKTPSGKAKAHARYCAELKQWDATLHLKYNPTSIKQTQLIQLLKDVGQYIGIGADRLEQRGKHGSFKVVSYAEEVGSG